MNHINMVGREKLPHCNCYTVSFVFAANRLILPYTFNACKCSPISSRLYNNYLLHEHVKFATLLQMFYAITNDWIEMVLDRLFVRRGDDMPFVHELRLVRYNCLRWIFNHKSRKNEHFQVVHYQIYSERKKLKFKPTLRFIMNKIPMQIISQN